MSIFFSSLSEEHLDAVIGMIGALGGAIVGGMITFSCEWWLQRRRIKQRVKNAAIIIRGWILDCYHQGNALENRLKEISAIIQSSTAAEFVQGFYQSQQEKFHKIVQQFNDITNLYDLSLENITTLSLMQEEFQHFSKMLLMLRDVMGANALIIDIKNRYNQVVEDYMKRAPATVEQATGLFDYLTYALPLWIASLSHETTNLSKAFVIANKSICAPLGIKPISLGHDTNTLYDELLASP